MEHVTIEINQEKFDEAVHSGLPEGKDLAIYVRRNATSGGRAAAVITFTVQLPDGTRARAQCVTTAHNIEHVGVICRAWRENGHI